MEFSKTVKKIMKGFLYQVKKKEKIPIPTQIDSTELLKGKIALITGGSGGIGKAIAKSFLLNGAKVIIAGTNEEKLIETCDLLSAEKNVEGLDERVKYIQHCVINVLNISEMDRIVEYCATLFDERRLDILVNAAGVINQADFLYITEDEYDRVMDINIKGMFFMSQAIGKYMIKNEIKGHILNLSSSSALRPAWTPYQISKWGVRGFTLGLADVLLPYGIVVNAIAPGPVATPMTVDPKEKSIDLQGNPSGRYAMPDEIANLATFMVSGMGDMIVGDTYYITGGSGTINSHF